MPTCPLEHWQDSTLPEKTMSATPAPESWAIPGTRRFVGNPCSRCGCALRYLRNRDCVDCSRRRVARRNKEQPRPPEKLRQYNLRKYGLSIEQFNAMFENQRSVCAICKTDKPGHTNWHVDHCHVSGPRSRHPVFLLQPGDWIAP